MDLRPVAVEMGGCGPKTSSSGDGRGCGAKTSSSGGGGGCGAKASSSGDGWVWS